MNTNPVALDQSHSRTRRVTDFGLRTTDFGLAVEQPRPASWRLLFALWLVAWLVYAAYFQGQWTFGERPIYYVTGDEPHYLVVATSLLRDHDLDVLNNYQHQDYYSFYPYHLGDARDLLDMHALYGRGGHVYSKHGLGLSLLVLPSFALGGAGAAKLFMMALAALLAALAYQLAREVTGRAGVALVAWLAVAFTPPLLLYADQLYPEVPGALLTLIALRGATAPRLMPGRAFAAGVALGALPWLHLRYLPLAAVLGAALVCHAALDLPASGRPLHWRRIARAPLWAAAVPAALAGGLLLALDWRLYGGLPSVDEYGAVTPANLLWGVPGLLLDQQFGLLVYSPALLAALAGLALVPRLGWLRGGTLLACFGVYFIFIGTFSYWFGAFSPPARMLVPVVALLVVPLALALDRWRTLRFRALFALLLALSWGIAHLLMDVPRLRYNLPDGQSQMLVYLQRVWRHDLVDWLPSFVLPTARSYVLAIGWLTAAAVVVLQATRQPHLPRSGSPRGALRRTDRLVRAPHTSRQAQPVRPA